MTTKSRAAIAIATVRYQLGRRVGQLHGQSRVDDGRRQTTVS